MARLSQESSYQSHFNQDDDFLRKTQQLLLQSLPQSSLLGILRDETE
jgi:hypothetical protein